MLLLIDLLLLMSLYAEVVCVCVCVCVCSFELCGHSLRKRKLVSFFNCFLGLFCLFTQRCDILGMC